MTFVDVRVCCRFFPDSAHVEQIDKEINRFIADAVEQAQKIIVAKKEEVEKVVAALLEKETLERDVFEKIVGVKAKKNNS